MMKLSPSTAPSARLRVAENGKRIVGAIIAANIDRESNMRGPVWPRKGSWEDSNAYFARLMSNGGGAGLDGLSFDVFAGCGILPSDDAAGLAEGGNVWTMAAGIGDSPDSRTPFLWTRNLRLTQEDLDAYVRDPNTDRSLAHRLDASMLPFGDEAVVMITKGGAMYPLKASQLTTKWFFGCVSPENVNGLEIVEAR